jgi:V8-like Glu-specific endopeptidase
VARPANDDVTSHAGEQSEGRFMQRPILRIGVSALLTAVALGLMAAPGHATAPSKDPDRLTTAPATWTDEATAAAAKGFTSPAEAYWTPERMRSASPPNVPAARQPSPKPVPAGRPGAVPATASVSPRVAPAAVNTSASVGKVFYFDPADGANHECSASTVTSGSRMLVVTAGHCVHGGAGRGWVQNWIFVPKFDNSSRPFGDWPAKWFSALDGWKNSSDIRRDVAFVTLAQKDGRRIGDVVGANGLSWNQAFEQTVTVLAYPADPPFSGLKQMACQGTTYRPGSWPFQEYATAINCGFTAGASGGPWLRNYNGALGEIVGIVGTTTPSGVNRSTYFDDEVHHLWVSMSSVT